MPHFRIHMEKTLKIWGFIPCFNLTMPSRTLDQCFLYAPVSYFYREENVMPGFRIHREKT